MKQGNPPPGSPEPPPRGATARERRLAILTSGGDAPGMNAVVRAAVRTALSRGAVPFAVWDGFQGLVDGGDRIREMSWSSVGGILHLGGTVIGSARCTAFRERDGRRIAARNLLEKRIDALICVGGDGTLTGADTLRMEWPSLLEELVARGDIAPEAAPLHPFLALVGLTGSIDNDMPGTDMTLGTDTALHRITDAVDALTSTAASHQRAFVVEVMGRRCGYLALMSGLATGAAWVLVPELPPDEGWEERMCARILDGRKGGRRHSTVLVAEGAVDRAGRPITADRVRHILEERLGLEARTTILGHVQRGGAPSAFDRVMGTLLGHAAVEEALSFGPDSVPQLIGLKENRIRNTPLAECVGQARAVAEALNGRDYERALSLRSPGFRETVDILRTLVRSRPHETPGGTRRFRIALLNAGAPAPGMNPAARAFVRLLLDGGHEALGLRNGFEGLLEGAPEALSWMSVHGWVGRGGAELGTSRRIPASAEWGAVARSVVAHRIDGLLVIGGFSGYEGVWRLLKAREEHPALNIPVVCLPAAIDNNLPGAELSLGADTALNSIVEAVDKIKQSAVAWRRAFVVEVMGAWCGYLAAAAGLATGAERVYVHEDPLTMARLERDVRDLYDGFAKGKKRLGLVIRNENAHSVFTTEFLRRLLDAEGKGLFDARQAILGHLQQGGNPTPFDRILATRLAVRCATFVLEACGKGEAPASFMGFEGGRLRFVDFALFPGMVDREFRRSKNPWWRAWEPVASLLDRPGASLPD